MKLRSLMTAICVLATANIVSAAPFAYIANSGTKNVSVIDTATNVKLVEVPLPDNPLATVHPYAYGVAVGASGQKVYVGLQNTNEIYIFDAATKSQVKRIGLGVDIPGGLAVNAAETRLYVTSNQSNTLIIIDITGSGAVELTRVAVETASISNPEGVVLNSAGNKAYVANSSKGTIAEIALDETNNVYTRTALISLGANAQPYGLAISSTGDKLYASSYNGTASMVDTATRAVTDLTLSGGLGAVTSVAITPDNSKIYAPSASLDQVYVINGATNTVLTGTNYPAIGGPWGSSITPDGTKLFLTMMSGGDIVRVFNTSSNVVDATINLPVGAKPTSMGSFIGPKLPSTITASNGAGCIISPLGAISVNNSGRSFNITANPGPCQVTVDGTQLGIGVSSYAFTNVIDNSSHTIDASQVIAYLLTANWTGGGNLVSTPQGSDPVGINATSKTTQIPAGTNVTISASGGWKAISWTGDCAGTPDGLSCYFPALSAPKTFAATLVPNLGGPIYNITRGTYHQTLVDALSLAWTSDVIKISTDYTAGCSAASGTATQVTLSGKWMSSDYTQKDAVAKSMGALTIGVIGVIADDLTI